MGERTGGKKTKRIKRVKRPGNVSVQIFINLEKLFFVTRTGTAAYGNLRARFFRIARVRNSLSKPFVSGPRSPDVFTFNFHPFNGLSPPCSRSRKETTATFSDACDAISARLRAHVERNTCTNSHGGGYDRRKTDVSRPVSAPLSTIRAPYLGARPHDPILGRSMKTDRISMSKQKKNPSKSEIPRIFFVPSTVRDR